MNKARRQQVRKIMEKLEDLKAELEIVLEDESMAFDNLPESLQYSERGEAMEESQESLQEGIDSIDESIEALMNAIE